MEYIINHQSYNHERLMLLVADKLQSGEPWEQAVFAFIRDWLSPLPTITLHTSGSTGEPKAMVFPKSALRASAEATLSFFKLQKGNVALLCLPAQYVAAKLMIVRCFVGQMDLVMVPPEGNPLTILDCDIDFAAMVPLQVQRIISESPTSLNRIRQLIVGGSAVNDGLRNALVNMPTHVWETYGMTETLTHVAVRKICENGGYEFEALPGVTFSQDNRGCLVVSVPAITSQPVVTNDLVQLVSETRCRLLGRADDVINSGGKKIHPGEIEQKLQPLIQLPFVISSIPHPLLGQQLVLVVETTGHFINTKGLFDGLEKHHQPRCIYCVPQFPRTESGKIIRSQLSSCLCDEYMVWRKD
jgi:O-succinylbenzoic acid--CoA ligase